MRKLLLLLFLAFNFLSQARTVMSWVPPYGISDSKDLLSDTTRSFWVRDGLSHIGLQFWVPGDSGSVHFVSDYSYQYLGDLSSDVEDFVRLGSEKNVDVMLCFFNSHDYDFDWSVAQTAFKEYPSETVHNLLAICDSFELKGIDIDFEGVGSFDDDKEDYSAFCGLLKRGCDSMGIDLSIDIFPTPCFNYPNPSWYPSLKDSVHFINIMGYDGMYEKNETYFTGCADPDARYKKVFKYSYVRDYARGKGVTESSLNYGVPTTVSDWGGAEISHHLYDIDTISQEIGIALWDLRLKGGGPWLEESTWELLHSFKNGDPVPQPISQSLHEAHEKESIVNLRGDEIVCLTEVKLNLYALDGKLIKSLFMPKGQSFDLSQVKENFILINIVSARSNQSMKYVK